MKRIPSIVLLAAGLLLPKLLGAVPLYLNYQGRMTQTGGSPVPDCLTNSATINLYTVASGGAAFWTEPETVATKNGLFTVELGHTQALSMPFDQPYWVEVVWWGTTMAPRQQLDTAPYAFRAAIADNAVSATTASGLILPQSLSFSSPGTAVLSGTNLTGIGLQGKGGTLGVDGVAAASGASGVFADYNGIGGAYALSVSGPAHFWGGPVSFTGSVDFSGAAVTGLSGGVPNPLSLTGNNAGQATISGTNSNATGVGLAGQGSTVGVSGTATLGGTGVGVLGQASSSNGAGVQGVNSGSGAAVLAQGATLGLSATAGGSTSYAVYGRASGVNSAGVQGVDDGAGGVAVWGVNNGSGNAIQAQAVSGHAIDAQASSTGIGAFIMASSGQAIFAQSTGGNGVQAGSNSGFGVQGTSNTNIGVEGVSNAGTMAGVAGIGGQYGVQGQGHIGVYGQSTTTGQTALLGDSGGFANSYALKVSGPAQFWGGMVSFTSSVDFSGATVTGLSGSVPNPLSLIGANPAGAIISGNNSAASGAGVVGQGQAYGVSGVAASATGAGVYGTNSNSSGYAMQAYNPNGVALYAQGAISVTTGSQPSIYVLGPSGSFLPGIKSISGGTGHAVEGSNSFYGGLGVLGGDLQTGYPGVYGINSTNSTQSFGVHGESPFAVGVIGDGLVGVEGKVTATGQVGLLGDWGGFAGSYALKVSGPAQFWGGLVDFSGATVTGLAGVTGPLSLTSTSSAATLFAQNTAFGPALVVQSNGIGVSVTSSSTTAPAMYVYDSGGGGFQTGILADAQGTNTAVEGRNSTFASFGSLGGVPGSGGPVGAYGKTSWNNLSAYGLWGQSTYAHGVHGDGPYGVVGNGTVGVYGQVTLTGQTGVLADYGGFAGSYAMKVSGPAQFFGGPVSFTTAVDFSGATVTGLAVSAPLSLTNASTSSTVSAFNTGGLALFAQGQGGISVTTSIALPAIYAQGFAGGFAPAIKVITSGTGHGVEAQNTFGGGFGILAGNQLAGQIGVYGSALQGPAGIMGEYLTGPGLLGQGQVGVMGKVTLTGQTGVVADGGGALGTALKVSGTALFYGGPVSFTTAVDFTGATVTGLSTGVPNPLSLTGSTAITTAVISGTNIGAGWGIYGKNTLPGSADAQGHILTPGAGVYGFTAVSLSAGVVGMSAALSNSAGVVGLGVTGIFGQTTAVGGNGGEFQADSGTALDVHGFNGASLQSQGGMALTVVGPSLHNGTVSITAGVMSGGAVLVVTNTQTGNGGSAIAGYINVSGAAALYGQSIDTTPPGPGSPSSAGVSGKGAVGVVGQNSIPGGIGIVGTIDATGNTSSLAVFGNNGGQGTGVTGQGFTGVNGSTLASNGVGVLASDGGHSTALALQVVGGSLFNGAVTFTGAVYGLPGVNVPLNLAGATAAPVMTAQNNGSGPGISGTALVANQAGVVGENDVFNGLGLLGLSANGIGVVGLGNPVGVSATSTGANGIGLYSRNNSGMAAIEAINDSTAVGNDAIFGKTQGGYGVYGMSMGANGVGVLGQGSVMGVQATLNGTFGDAFSTGAGLNTSGNAAYLVNAGGNGVYGAGTTHGLQAGLVGNTGDAIYASVSTTGYAANLTNNGSGQALTAIGNNAGTAVSVANNGSGSALYGTASGYNFALVGSNTVNSGFSGGVRGDGGPGIGVFGNVSSGTALYGQATTGNGVFGTTSAAGGSGVSGQGVTHGMNATISGAAGDAYYANIATTGNVANFQNTGTGGGLNTIITGGSGGAIGVWGQNSSTGGGSVGVRGTASGALGAIYGLYGDTASSSGVAVYGTNSGGGNGVVGNANGTGNGVVGSASGTGSGVVGSSSGTGAGGQFSGPTAATAAGTAYGLSATASNGNGVAILGRAYTTGSVIQAINDGTAGSAILGAATGGGTGVKGQVVAATVGSKGVWGTVSVAGGVGVEADNTLATAASGAALYVNGPMKISGTAYSDATGGITTYAGPTLSAASGSITFSAAKSSTLSLTGFTCPMVTNNSVILVTFNSVTITGPYSVLIPPGGGTFNIKFAVAQTVAANDMLNYVIINQ